MVSTTLPRLPVFEAIAKHDPESTVVVHSASQRTFKYGELLADVCRTRDRLLEAAGKTDINGERVAFLVENSYDYIGKFEREREVTGRKRGQEEEKVASRYAIL